MNDQFREKEGFNAVKTLNPKGYRERKLYVKLMFNSTLRLKLCVLNNNSLINLRKKGTFTQSTLLSTYTPHPYLRIK